MTERKRKADFLRYMRKIKTPQLTTQERNRTICSLTNVYMRNTRYMRKVKLPQLTRQRRAK